VFQRRKAARTCPQGHPLDESWEQCPFCAADRDRTPAATEVVRAPRKELSTAERMLESGTGAVVVPRKAPASRRLAGWVVITRGDDTDRDFRLHGGPNVLGKGPECDVVIRDALASHRHAMVDCRKDAYTVEDLDSRHGTRVNGEPLEGTRPLRDGDRIRIGNTELRFRSYSD